jgi:undecaprenyl-diphosphatase
MQNLNLLVFHTLQDLHNPPFDWLMTFVTSLGDLNLLLAIVLLTAGFLIRRRNLLALWHWLAAFALPWLLVRLLNRFYTQSPPPGLNTIEGLSYPSGHATLATAVYGFLAILLTREMRPLHRLPLYVGTVLLVLLIAFSRLYLGAQWLGDVLAGLLLGLAWTALLGIAYRRHASHNRFLRNDRFWLTGLIAVLMLSYPFSVQQEKLQRFEPVSNRYVMGRAAWLDTGWQVLPAVREDLRGHNRLPFNLQWAGTETAIRRGLEQAGWQPVRNDLRQYLSWLNPAAGLTTLPVLPHVHNGVYDRLRYVRLTPEGAYLVIRLWPALIEIQGRQGQKPLWFGNVTRLVKTDLYGLHFLVTVRDFESPLEWVRLHPPGATIVARRERQIATGATTIRFPLLLLETGP